MTIFCGSAAMQLASRPFISVVSSYSPCTITHRPMYVRSPSTAKKRTIFLKASNWGLSCYEKRNTPNFLTEEHGGKPCDERNEEVDKAWKTESTANLNTLEISEKLKIIKNILQNKLQFEMMCKTVTNAALILVSATLPLIFTIVPNHRFLVRPIVHLILTLAKPVSNFIWEHRLKRLKEKEKSISSMLDIIHHEAHPHYLTQRETEGPHQLLLQKAILIVRKEETMEELVDEFKNATGKLFRQIKEHYAITKNAREVIDNLLPSTTIEESS